MSQIAHHFSNISYLLVHFAYIAYCISHIGITHIHIALHISYRTLHATYSIPHMAPHIAFRISHRIWYIAYRISHIAYGISYRISDIAQELICANDDDILILLIRKFFLEIFIECDTRDGFLKYFTYLDMKWENWPYNELIHISNSGTAHLHKILQ